MVILHQILEITSKGVTFMKNVSIGQINKLVSLQLGVRDVRDDSLLVEGRARLCVVCDRLLHWDASGRDRRTSLELR